MEQCLYLYFKFLALNLTGQMIHLFELLFITTNQDYGRTLFIVPRTYAVFPSGAFSKASLYDFEIPKVNDTILKQLA